MVKTLPGGYLIRNIPMVGENPGFTLAFYFLQRGKTTWGPRVVDARRKKKPSVSL
jgi:hypothetical protein